MKERVKLKKIGTVLTRLSSRVSSLLSLRRTREGPSSAPSRRTFLEISVPGVVAVGCSQIAQAGGQAAPASHGLLPALDNNALAVLRAVVGEIIPAGDGMPAATEVGSQQYLERLVRSEFRVADEIQGFLKLLEELSDRLFKQSFALITHEKRVTALMTVEKEYSHAFTALRDMVYESYYVQPRIQQLLGYTCFSTSEKGPTMEAFDDSILREVRKKPKLYREV